MVIDHFLTRKKNPTKNSVKIRKFLTSFLGKGMEEVRSHAFLEFISVKHKIPIEVLTQPPKLHVGYVTNE